MSKKLAVILSAIVALCGLAAFVVVPMFIDKDKIKDQISRIAMEKTGRELIINGDISAGIIPSPNVTISEVYLANANNGYAEYFVKVDKLKVELGWDAVFSGKVKPESISLSNPEVNLEILPDGKQNWNFAAYQKRTKADEDSSENTAAENKKLTKLPVGQFIANNGYITHRISRTAKLSEVKNINLNLQAEQGLAGEIDLSGTLLYHDIPFGINIQKQESVEAADESGVKAPVEAEITVGSSAISGKGFWLGGSDGKFEGGLTFASEDVVALVGALSGSNCVAEKSKPLALQATTESSINPTQLSFNKLEINSDFLRMNMVAAISLEQGFAMNSKADIGFADADTLKESFGEILAAECFDSAEVVRNGNRQGFFADNAKARFSGSAKKVLLNGLELADIEFITALNDSDITVDQFTAQVPGESSASAFGLVKLGSGKPRFDGRLEVSGKNLAALINWLAPGTVSDDGKVLREFALESNAGLDAEEIRLTEINSVIDETRIQGVSIVKFGNIPEIEAQLRFSALNVDKYLQNRKKAAAKSAGDKVSFDLGSSFNWLNDVNFKAKANMAFEQLVIGGEKIENVQAKFNAAKSALRVFDTSINYKDYFLSGGAEINTASAKPFITADFRLSDFDTSVLLGKAKPEESQDQDAKAGTSRWSKTPIDIKFLETINGSFNVKADNFRHKEIRLQNLSAKANLDEGSLEIKDMSADLLDGKIESRFTVNSGTLPSFSAAVAFNNLEAPGTMQAFMNIDNITAGRLSGNGTVKASGISQAAMVENLEGTIAIAGANLVFSGYDISSLARGAANIRTVADAVSLGSQSFSGGETFFDSLSGAFYIEKGVANTPGITVVNDAVEGKFTGIADLPRWLIDGNAAMQLRLPGTEEFPVIGVSLTGPLDSPKRSLDTSDLQRYVARRAATKIIEDPDSIKDSIKNLPDNLDEKLDKEIDNVTDKIKDIKDKIEGKESL
jgi:uncharacterized protein involved in outer membrane biogenesis